MDQLIYIGAALAIGLLIGFVALCVLWLRRTMLRNVRSHTLNLLSAYDDLLAEKSRELSEMEEKLQKAALEKREEAPAAPAPKAEPEFRLSTSAVLAASQRAAEASYRDKAVGDTYRQIRESFSFDMEELLPLLQGQPQEPGKAEKLLHTLEFDTVYRLSTLTEEQQLAILRECLDSDGKALLEGYLANGKTFRVLEFYSALQSQAAAESKAVRLYVPKNMARGNSGSLQVVGDPDICEGFQAELGGRLYDYSIKTRELS